TTTTNVNGTDTIAKITWYDGSLPDELYQDFGLQFKVSDLPLNTTLYFPVTQETIPNGTLSWTSVPDATGKLADSSHPAPKLTIAKAATAASSTTTTNSSATIPVKSSAATAIISVGTVMLAMLSAFL
ncbi:hypothetical protein DYB32_009746, partial [Aphanomyces invadans]